MKKISFLLLGIAMCLQSTAQNSKVTSANMHLESYASQKDTSELSAAKEAIDEAALNDKTKDEPKMYLYRGEIYLDCFGESLNNLVSKSLRSGSKDAAKAKADAYTNIDTNFICIAANSFVKAIQLAPNDFYAQEAKQPENLSVTCLVHLENKALREYAAKRYTTSLALYKKILSICTLLNKTDSAYMQNVDMAAGAAEESGNTAAALTYYEQLINLKYGGASTYHSLASMYLKQKDSAKAWQYIEQGRAQYPNDLNLIITETNFYILKHDYEKAENNLTLSIQKLEQSPDRDKNKPLLSSLYSNLGGIYDRKANPKDAQGGDLPKPPDYDELFAKADSNYMKALAISPTDFDVLFSTGALYFNRAVPITKQANDLPLNATDKYNKLMAQAKVYFLQAQPYFEKAYSVNPNDAGNTNALREVYANTGQNDKIEAMKSKK